MSWVLHHVVIASCLETSRYFCDLYIKMLLLSCVVAVLLYAVSIINVAASERNHPLRA